MINLQNQLSDQALILALAASKDAIAVYCTASLHIRFVSDAMLRIWGKDSSITGQTFEEAIPEMAGQPFEALLKQAWQTGETYVSADTPANLIINGQLTTSYFDFEYRPLLNEAGKTFCILHTATNVTERLKAWQVAREKEALAQQLNEELAAANEELTAINEEYQATNEELNSLNEEYQSSNDEMTALNEEYQALNEELNATNEELNLSKNELIKAGELMRFAIEAANVGTWYFPADTRELVTSPKLKALFGYGAEEAMPYAATVKQIDPDYRDKVVAAVDAAINKGETYDMEFPVIDHATRRPRWVRAFGKLYPALAGNPAHVSGLMIDITAQKMAQHNVELSEQRFRSLAEASEVMISINNVEGDVEYVNQAWLNLTGRTLKEMQAYGWGDFLHPDDQETLLHDFRAGISSKAAFTVEFRMMNKHNQPRWIYTKVNPRLAPDGTYAGTISSSIDITERRQFQEEIQEVNDRLQIALDAGGFGSTEVDLATGNMICNDQFKKLFGRRPDEVMTYPDMFAAMLPHQRDEIRRRSVYAQKNRTVYKAEYEIAWPDGSIHWLSAHGRARYNNLGEPVKMVGILSDITESKRDDQRKNDFIGMVSHELKTPLTSLTAIVQLANLKLKSNTDPFLSGAMEKANTQVKRMGNMINGFLNVSRLESGKILIVKELFELDELIKEAVKDSELTTTTHIIHTNVCNNVQVFADKDKIASVITNLLSNAVKYSPRGNNIYVTCQITDTLAKVSIRDEGMGIKAADQNKLFERYYRVETTHTKNISGFGIGLYLSAEIIERHDGKIWVESEPGKGSTFYFTIPLSKAGG